MTNNDDVRITLRLPVELRKQLKAASEVSGRSMNGEIIALLQMTLERSGNGSRNETSLKDRIVEAAEDREDFVNELLDTGLWISVLSDTNQTIKLLARTIGHIFLSDGDGSEVLKIIASGLSQLSVDDQPSRRKQKK
ncbi:Arc family DNA-binding protein [Rhizobium sp. P32RR-XVIII]|uniref:Arc family DNA-binding protein n=1 Tax=Rhizobium sp. P32RR-XVIII TaxID=2726738 RepID=UPI001456DF09|nr:Arc family DNA-binding protein [Rhizobium sp. P32RR-XVIII]NLS03485.1 Arc family DNA-binding protein [Rhizobium sp. P32RR-XVIII]